MKIKELKKLLSSNVVREIPPDLRDELVRSIPDDFKQTASEQKGTWQTIFAPSKRKFAYTAVAAVALFVVFSFIGPRSGDSPANPFSPVSAAVAEVIENLESKAALYIELDMRTGKRESFEYVDPENDFSRIKIWLEHPSDRFKNGRMKIEKKERKTVFNGESTLFHILELDEAKFLMAAELISSLQIRQTGWRRLFRLQMPE